MANTSAEERMKIRVTHSEGIIRTSLRIGEREIWTQADEYSSPLSTQDLVDLDWYWERHHESAVGAYGRLGIEILTHLPSFSRKLWDSLRVDQVLAALSSMPSRGIESVILQSSDPLFLAQPWELMQRAGDDRPLALRGTAIIRSLHGRSLTSAHPRAPQPVQRILLVVARPSDLYAPSVGCVAGPLAAHLAGSPIEVTLLTSATPTKVAQAIATAAHQEGPYDLVHLDVHGASGVMASFDSPTLLFESETGSSMPVEQREVASWLSKGLVRTMVLSSCRSIRPDTYMVQSPVTDVIGLSHELHPEAVFAFYGPFYQAICDGQSVSVAVCRARMALASDPGKHAASWPTVQHLHDPDSALDWSVPAKTKHPNPPATPMTANLLDENLWRRLSRAPAKSQHSGSAEAISVESPNALHAEDSLAWENIGYLDADLWFALDAALRNAGITNIFGLRGYGRSTLLTACRSWLDSYLVSVPCILLNGATVSAGELIPTLNQYRQRCATFSQTDSSELSRDLAGAVLIDDIDLHDISSETEFGNCIDTLAERNIAFVCTSIARQHKTGIAHIRAPGSSRSILQILAGSAAPEIINDLNIFADRCPGIINNIEKIPDPEAYAKPCRSDVTVLA